MARDILSEFGPDMSGSRSVDNRASNGGQRPVRDVMNYSPPTGRAGSTAGPGLGGDSADKAEQFGCGCGSSSGSPGLHGTNHGVCGSQK